MSMFLEIKDGYYILPEGASLYRGDNSIYDKIQHGEPTQFDDKITYFCYTAEAADQYGVIFEFKTDKEYKLLALDNPVMMERFYDNSPDDIQRILKSNYGFVSGIRDSKVISDNVLSEYLCDNGYDGYATDFMPTSKEFKNEDGKYPQFHQEIMLCHPRNLQLFEQITTDQSVINSKMSEYNNRKISVGTKKSKRPPSSPIHTNTSSKSLFNSSIRFDSPPRGNSLFGFDSPPKKMNYGSPPPKGNNLFGFNTPGGKGKKTIKRKNKKSKSNKKRKSHKKRKTN